MSPFAYIWRGAVILIGLSALVPTRTGSLGSHPHPAASYAAAVERATRQQEVDDSVAAPEGRTILLTHGHRVPRVFVLLHGLTDSPRQFLPLANEFFADGANVYVPRLPEHAQLGGDARELAHLTAEQLRGCADSAVDVAVGLGDTIIIVGLSAGGTMAAWIGQFRPEATRVVMIAPALEAGELPQGLEDRLVNLTLRAPSMTKRASPDTSAPDREPGFNTHAIAQTFRLGVAVRKAAEQTPGAARQAIFLINAHDRTVKGATALDLAHRWSAHGMAVSAYQIPDSLLLPHDVVDVALRTGKPEIMRPILVALGYGKKPPPWISILVPRVALPDSAKQQ